MDTYEKKYKEALELAQKLYQDCPNGKNDRLYHTTDLEKMFPELKESEDGRIKKEIISFIQDDIDEINLKVSGDYDDRDEDDIAHQNWCKKAIAWLENIPYTIDHEKREGFHLGYKAGLEKQGETSPILSNSSNIGKDGQKPTIEMKSAEENLGIDSETYNKIVDECIYGGDKQKPAWSEKDEKEYKYVLKFVDNILNNCGNKKDYEHCKRCYDWLKSIKQKIGG